MTILRSAFLLTTASIAGAQAPCTRVPTRSVTSIFAEPVSATATDSVITVRVCLSSTKVVGSYMATVTFDSSRMRVVRVDPRGGMQATNARTSGVVRIAGAAPSGFPNGELAQIVFKTAGRTLARISLELSEVHALSGASLLGESAATGWPAGADVVTRPVIDSISPRTGALDHERVTDITIYGRGFAARGNLVLFGAAKVPGLMSEAGGTLIRFSAPSLQMKDGKIPIRVWHDGVESNVVNFAVRDEGP